MAEVDWALLCDYSFLDVGRKMCVIGVFDRIFTPAVPAQQHQAAIVIRFSGDPGETVKFKVEAIRPIAAGGGTVATLAGETKIGDTGGSEFSANIVGLPLPDYGSYAFQVYISDKMAKVITFNVDRPPTQTINP